MFLCPACKAKCRRTDLVCGRCGTKLRDTCPYCGMETFIMDNCEHCKASLFIKCECGRLQLIQPNGCCKYCGKRFAYE